MNLLSPFLLLLVMASVLFSCDDDEDATLEVPSDSRIQEAYFSAASLQSFALVDCTLENGSSTSCYRLVFSSNPVADGPYCPETIDDIGGVGIYDGATNPGFQVLKRSLWEAMEADGYDIVDDEGNITIEDPGAGQFPMNNILAT